MNYATLTALALALTTSACQSLENGRTGLALRELHASNHCVSQNAELQLPDNTAEALSMLGLNRVIGAKPPVLHVDNNAERMLLVAAGQKSSAGYRLRLSQQRAELHDGVLSLPVALSVPGGDRQAAVMTSPCLLLAVERGRYQRIVVESMGLALELSEN